MNARPTSRRSPPDRAGGEIPCIAPVRPNPAGRICGPSCTDLHPGRRLRLSWLGIAPRNSTTQTCLGHVSTEAEGVVCIGRAIVNTTGKIALAASGGYILGRTKKMKLAVMLALLLAGQKLPKSPLELVQQGAGALTKNEKVAELSQQVTGSLLDAGKAAAGRSAERWLTGVGDKLRDGLSTSDTGSDDEAGDEDAEATDEVTDEDTDAEEADTSDSDDADDADAADDDAEDAEEAGDEGDDEAAGTDEASDRSGESNGKPTRSRSRSTRSSRQSSSGGRTRTTK